MNCYWMELRGGEFIGGGGGSLIYKFKLVDGLLFKFLKLLKNMVVPFLFTSIDIRNLINKYNDSYPWNPSRKNRLPWNPI